MPIDSIFAKHLADELNSELHHASIKRIYNISNNEFLFKFHNKKNLYISLNNECRINITDFDYTFPTKPSNTTMLLRKYLNNYKVLDICSYNKDRIIRIELSGYNELKDITTYYLYIELFGRFSNLILTQKDNTIINALKLINSEEKTILPNYKYNSRTNDEYVISNKVDLTTSQALDSIIKPCATEKDFYFTNVFNEETTTFDSLSQLLNSFYTSISKKRRINFLTGECQKKINLELKKLKRKLKYLNQDLENSNDYNKYKLYGDLILTYGYQNKNKDELTCNDFENNSVTIKLNNTLSVSDNANKYYARYAKLKRSIEHINNQLQYTNDRIYYLENLLFQLDICSEIEITQIYDEYTQTTRKKSEKNSSILKIETDQYTILIGKNNLQNEEITFKLSRRDDIWFHVKDLPGSHVILKCDDVSDEIIEIAAKYAAIYSKAKNYPKVEVTYTNVKNVKKISGSYPGHVSIINESKTIIVEPNIN